MLKFGKTIVAVEWYGLDRITLSKMKFKSFSLFKIGPFRLFMRKLNR